MESKIQTQEEIRATFARVREQIAGMDLRLDATIDHDPIGRRERGKCRVQVERAALKGYRTVRTTTNKFGRWCAPKKSTYGNAVTVVVSKYDDEHQVVWLSVGNPAAQWGGTHVCVRYANGEGVALPKCWRNDAPRREPHTYTTTWTKSTLSITGAGVETGEPTQQKETHTLEADSPEECDAWDVWVEELKSDGRPFGAHPRLPLQCMPLTSWWCRYAKVPAAAGHVEHAASHDPEQFLVAFVDGEEDARNVTRIVSTSR